MTKLNKNICRIVGHEYVSDTWRDTVAHIWYDFQCTRCLIRSGFQKEALEFASSYARAQFKKSEKAQRKQSKT